jgi:hypothetical protein
MDMTGAATARLRGDQEISGSFAASDHTTEQVATEVRLLAYLRARS